MDYEKAYKTALEKAKIELNADTTQGTKNVLMTVFPELKESEDEKIRKTLIFYLGDMPEDTELRNGVTNRDVLAWLEKQGERKVPINDFKAKDWYVSEVNGKIHDMTYNPADKVEQKSIMNVPSREVILAIWDLGNEWKELTSGDISTEYGTQLDYIQNHWQESEYYLREKQNEQKSKEEIKTTAYGFFGKYGAVEYVYILDYSTGRVMVVKHSIEESIEDLFKKLGLKESQCHYMVSSDILSIEYINF